MSQQPTQQAATTRGRGRARGRAAAASLRQDEPPQPPSPQPQGPAAVEAATAAEAATGAEATTAAEAPETPAAQPAAVQGAEGGDDDVDRLARRVEQARLGVREGPGGERGGLSRKLLRYHVADIRPPGVEVTRGASGQVVALTSNYIRLVVGEVFRAYQNVALFQPRLDSKPLRQRILQDCGHLPASFIYDGGILYTPMPLHQAPPEGLRFEAAAGRWSGEVAIRQIGAVQANSPQYIHLLNVLLAGTQQDLGMIQVQRNFYFPDQAIPLPEFQLQLWPCIEAAVGPSTEPRFPLLHINVSHKDIHDQSVLQLMYQLYNLSGSGTFNSAINDLIAGQSVITTYNHRTIRIDEIDWESRITREFECRDSATNARRQISVEQYYLEKYNIQLTDPDQPLLVSRPRRREQPAHRDPHRAPRVSLLPPELCILTGLTEDMRRNFQLMRAKANITRQNPTDRSNRLINFAQTMADNGASRQRLASYGVEIRPELVQLQGRRLDPERVIMATPDGARTELKYPTDKADWDANLRNACMHTPVRCNNWLCIFLERERAIAEETVQNIIRFGGNLGGCGGGTAWRPMKI